ncbi:hypothetical protein [Polaromonas sp. YR568]|uniref:hypothetical protein n=1 Tax=Polaromonas sp. YR568 TaxID=1855301 RepID=UPI00313792B7
MKITQRTDEGAAPASPLAALADQAQGLLQPPAETGGDTPEGEVTAPGKMSNAQVLMMAVELVRDTLCTFAKVTSPKTTMANEVMQPVVDANAAVLDKYGVDLSKATGDYMTEIKAAMVTVPVLLAIRSGLSEELKAAKATTTTAPAAGGPVVLSAVPVDGQQ